MENENQAMKPKNYLDKAAAEFSKKETRYDESKFLELKKNFDDPEIPETLQQDKNIIMLFALLKSQETSPQIKNAIYDVLKLVLQYYTDEDFKKEIEQGYLCRPEIQSVQFGLDDSGVPFDIRITIPSPNSNSRKNPKNEQDTPIDTLVMHYTVSPFVRTMLLFSLPETSSNNESSPYYNRPSVSAHYVIDESGLTISMVPEEKKAWHAGLSKWRELSNVNLRSIGIENVNSGYTIHKDTGEPVWAEFPEAQQKAIIGLSADILSRHNIKPCDVIGHQDIAPNRKSDPGIKFPWRRLENNNLAATAYDIEISDVKGANEVICQRSASQRSENKKVQEMSIALKKIGYFTSYHVRTDPKKTDQYFKQDGDGEDSIKFTKSLANAVNAFKSRALQDCPPYPIPQQPFASWTRLCQKRIERMLEKQEKMQKQPKLIKVNETTMPAQELSVLIESLASYNKRAIIASTKSRIIAVKLQITNQDTALQNQKGEVDESREVSDSIDEIKSPILSYLQTQQTIAQKCPDGTVVESRSAPNLPAKASSLINKGILVKLKLGRKNYNGQSSLYETPFESMINPLLNKVATAAISACQQEPAKVLPGSTETESIPDSNLPEKSVTNSTYTRDRCMFKVAILASTDSLLTTDSPNVALNKAENAFLEKFKTNEAPPSGNLEQTLPIAALERKTSTEKELIDTLVATSLLTEDLEESKIAKTHDITTHLDSAWAAPVNQEAAQHQNDPIEYSQAI